MVSLIGPITNSATEGMCLTASVYCSLNGFTNMSEALISKDIGLLIGEYIAHMTDPMTVTGAHVDFLGDIIVGFWTTKDNVGESAQNAFSALSGMLLSLSALNEKMLTIGLPQLSVCLGASVGQAFVGNFGPKAAQKCAAYGAVINLAARLSGLGQGYGVTSIVSHDFREALGNDVGLFRDLDDVRIKGQSDPVRIYEPLLGGATDVDRMKGLMSEFGMGRDAYRRQMWDQALLHFKKCKEIVAGDNPSDIYIQRIAEVRQYSLKDWDGVYMYSSR